MLWDIILLVVYNLYSNLSNHSQLAFRNYRNAF